MREVIAITSVKWATRTSWHLCLTILKSITEVMEIVHGVEGNGIWGGLKEYEYWESALHRWYSGVWILQRKGGEESLRPV